MIFSQVNSSSVDYCSFHPAADTAIEDFQSQGGNSTRTIPLPGLAHAWSSADRIRGSQLYWSIVTWSLPQRINNSAPRQVPIIAYRSVCGTSRYHGPRAAHKGSQNLSVILITRRR